MKTKVSIEGMCCKSCTVHLSDALKKVEGVDKVRVNFRKNEAIIKSKQDLESDEIKKVVEEEGYLTTAIEKL